VIDWLQKHPHRAALIFLAVLPIALLWPSLLGRNTYVPYDLAQFAPVATTLSQEQWEQTVHEDNTDVTEIPVMFGPQLEFIRSELHQGRIVHWDPYSRSGTPMWASSILGIAYPLNWPLFLGLDPYYGFGLSAYLTFVIASMLMYGFLVQLGLGPLPALFGAIAFAYSGTLTINSHFYQRISALIWLPGILWAIQSVARNSGRRRIPAMLCLALCMFMTMTAGFPPFALVVSFVAVAFTAWLLVAEWRRGGPRLTLALAGVVATGAILGVLAAAVQLLPMAEFFPVSNRDIQVSGNGIAYIGFNWYGLLGYLMPDLFSHPHVNEIGKLPDTFSPLTWYLQTGTRWVEQLTDKNVLLTPGTYFQPNYNFCEYTVFIGVVAVFLALAGALHRRAGFRRFALGTLAALVLLATSGWWMSWLISQSPFRWVPPMRYMGPACMLLATLAAMGLGALPQLRRWTILTLGIGGLVAASICFSYWAWVSGHNEIEILQAMLPTLQQKYSPELGNITLEGLQKYLGPNMPVARLHMLSNLAYAGWLLAGCSLAILTLLVTRLRHRAQVLQVLALVVLVVELLSFAIPLNRGRELKHPHHTGIHDFLVEQRDRYQPQGGFTVMRASAGSEPVIQRQLPGGTLLNDRIRDLNSYTFMDRHSHKPILKLYGPRYLSRRYWPMALPDDERLRRPYFDLLGVRFVLAEEPLRHAGGRLGPEWKGPRGEFFVYERDTALPGAFVVPTFRTVSGGEDAIIEALVGTGFAPRSYCLLNPETAARLSKHLGGQPYLGTASVNGRKVVFDKVASSNDLRLQVAAGEPGYLVINLTSLPGWSATVNSEPTPIYTTNLFLTMIPLGPDAAQVELSYITPGFRPGLWVTLLSFTIMAGLFLCYRRSRPPAGGDEIPL